MGLFSDWRAFHRASRAHGGSLRILKEAARDLASLKEPMEGVALPEGAVEVVAPEGAVSTEDVDRDFETECWGALDALAEAGGGTVLAMGMGGERLALLLEHLLPKYRAGLDVVAVEERGPAATSAHERLGPLGARVEERADAGSRLPLADGSARLVMNRLKALSVPDVVRVLAPGGLLITQQVDDAGAPGTPDIPVASEAPGTPGTRGRLDARASRPSVRLRAMTAALSEAGLIVESTSQWSRAVDVDSADELAADWGAVHPGAPGPDRAAALARIREESGGGPVLLVARRFCIQARRPS